MGELRLSERRRVLPGELLKDTNGGVMSNEIQEIPIKVSARILRHMSRGIYRTPAGAIKELVSNAYDAGATKVTINTGYPVFEKIVVTDNGKGMNKQEFTTIIQNIGLTDKVAGTKFKLPGTSIERVTIGHYGIGILAIGQLCKRVKIISKIKNSLEGFEATLDFEQFEVKRINGIERALVKDEQKIERKDRKLRDLKSEEENKFPIGKCSLKFLEYSAKDSAECFTRLELEEVRDTVQRKLSGRIIETSYSINQQKVYSANFEELLRLFREKEEEIKRGQYPYEKLCWELAVYSPVKYPDLKEFGHGGKLHFFKRLSDSYEFELVIDGMTVFKPHENIFFEDTNYPVKDVFVWKDESYKVGKKVSGYIIVKRRIRPKCMQGILIRETGVAIGMYDLTFLEYPYHEAAKFEQLTGELFVEGLSGALNIDRDSFNETDENYLALAGWFHKKLHDEVFPKIKKEMQRKRREDASETLTKSLGQYFKKFNKGYRMELRKLGKERGLFRKTDRVLYINKDHREGKPSKSTVEKLFLASVLVALGVVSASAMEEILDNIANTKKGLEKHD